MGDRTIRDSAIAELDFEPSIDAAEIAVSVDDGIVTLGGHVANFVQREAAKRATKKVRGVRAVVERIEVRFSRDKPPLDEDLAKRAVQLLDWNVVVPKGAVQVKVQGGCLTLTGTVEWQYQKAEAKAAPNRLPGVVSIVNLIEVTPKVSATDVRGEIEAALKRNAQVEADAIHVDVSGGKVTLKGKVHAWHERGIAERAAWSAPGVRTVEDRIEMT
ncbi:BON domain-containing protein [Methylobacterium haplocladii]|uniref:BON domain-containing protein n=1 Tax=Methylobacterium haplocladii TaxID=1176176 RepID=A0A512IPI7_9HYPH|nr:BON domain-containing protein [Methylobacterium haplocladii]GEO99582.1 BON domain-containing protein [Methylobacterium haplocladii]GJD85873.1 hypothetical protein HPGCJGGD_3767 [Methylobacterium haplocladii]GLS58558.1 BON domain-containing protein [Methylobacterium haplocladii]